MVQWHKALNPHPFPLREWVSIETWLSMLRCYGWATPRGRDTLQSATATSKSASAPKPHSVRPGIGVGVGSTGVGVEKG